MHFLVAEGQAQMLLVSNLVAQNFLKSPESTFSLCLVYYSILNMTDPFLRTVEIERPCCHISEHQPSFGSAVDVKGMVSVIWVRGN